MIRPISINLTRILLFQAALSFLAPTGARSQTVDSLSVTRAVIVADEIDFRMETEPPEGVVTEITGPIIFEVPAFANPLPIDTASIEPGTYTQMRIELKPLADPNDPAIRNLTDLPTSTFADRSIYIEGFVGDSPTTNTFIFTADFSDSLRIDNQIVIAPGQGTSVLLQLDTSAFFVVGGEVLDPRDPANQQAIADNIRSLIDAIEIRDDEEEFRDDIRIEAVIDSVVTEPDGTVSSIVVLGRTVLLTPMTQIESFGVGGELSPGTRVEVEGGLQDDGSLVAEFIEIFGALQDSDVFLLGAITSIQSTGPGAADLVVLGLSVSLGPDVEIKTDQGMTLTAEDLSVGLRVEVDGQLQEDGSILTAKLFIENDFDEDEVDAVIQQIEPGGAGGVITLTVAGLTITLDGNTQVRGNVSGTLVPEDLAVGQRVEIDGSLQPDGSILAREVSIDEDRLDEFASIRAPIQSLTQEVGGEISSIVLAGIAVSLDGETVIEDDDGNVIASSMLSVGLRVDVRGSRQPDDSFLAASVEVDQPLFANAAVLASANLSLGNLAGSITVSIQGTGAFNKAPITAIDFALDNNAAGWIGQDFASLGSRSTVAVVAAPNNVSGLCIASPPSGENLGQWDSPRSSAIELTANSVYRVRFRMNTDQNAAGAQVIWNILVDNLDPAAGTIVWGSERWFYDNTGFANGIGNFNRDGLTEFDAWIAPNPVQTSAWNGDVDNADSPFDSGGANGAGAAFNIKFRVLDLSSAADGALGSALDFGQVCLQSVQVDRFDLSSLATDGGPLWGSETSVPANVDVLFATDGAAIDTTGENIVIELDEQAGSPGIGRAFVAFRDATSSGLPAEYPVLWNDGDLLRLTAEIRASAPGGTAPVDVIATGWQTATNELGGTDFSFRGAPGVLNLAAAPRDDSVANSTYTSFFYTHHSTDVDPAALPDANRLRGILDFFNRTDLAGALGEGVRSDALEVRSMAIHRIVLEPATFGQPPAE